VICLRVGMVAAVMPYMSPRSVRRSAGIFSPPVVFARLRETGLPKVKAVGKTTTATTDSIEA